MKPSKRPARSSTPAAAPKAVVCRYGDGDAGDRAHPPVDLPSNVALFVSAQTDGAQALREAALAHPGCDIALLRADAMLPANALDRLRLAREALPKARVWTPLCAQTPALDPRPVDSADELTSAAIDGWAWLLAERAYAQVEHCSPLLAYWTAEALTELLSAKPTLGAPSLAPARLHLCDTLFVATASSARPERAEAGCAAIESLRQRLQALPGSAPEPALIGLDGKPVLLHLLHGWGGGAARFVGDLMQADTQHRHLVLIAESDAERKRHGTALVLRDAPDGIELKRWNLPTLSAPTRLDSPAYKSALRAIYADFGVAGLLVSSLIGHSLDALRSGLPTAVVCHDYYPLWPLLHTNFDAAAEAFAPEALPAALRGAGSEFEFSERDPAYWLALREAYLAALTGSDALLIAPSRCVRDNLCRIAPALVTRRWQQIGHGLKAWPEPVPAIGPDPHRADLRIVVVGRIRGGKGETLLADLLPQLPADVELVLLGCGAAGMRFFGLPQVHVQLDYAHADLPAELARLKPDAALLPASVAETFSYTLSELRALGVPVIATARGSYVERIQDGLDGLLVAADAISIANLLHQLVDDCGPLLALRQRWPSPSLADMAQAYAAALTLSSHAPRALARDPLLLERSLRSEQARLALTARCAKQAEQLQRQQSELERRAEWAKRESQEAQARLVWAQALQAEVADVNALVISTQALLDTTDAALQAKGAEAQELAVALEQSRAQAAADLSDFESRYAEMLGLVESLTAQRDHFQGERDLILASSSWRLTKPFRYLRRLLGRAFGGILTRLRFRLSRLQALRQRASLSLKMRGVGGTLKRMRQEALPAKPSTTFAIPAPPVVHDDIPEVDDIVFVRVKAPRASIIVPVFNQLMHTVTCLRALAGQAQRSSFEVIVVDDGSSDASADLLPKLPGLRYVRNAENLGFIGACNAGAAVSEGEYLVFLNNDTAVQPGWLDALLDTFKAYPQAGLVGAKLVYPDGRLQEAGGIVFNDGSGWNYGRFEDPADPRFGYVREVDYCSGAAIALPKVLFDSLGGFDSHYAPAYYEDTDLAMKVRAAGRRVLYQPASVVVHFEGISSGTDTSTGVKAYQVVNQKKFLERWRDTLASHPSPPPATPIEVARQHRARRHVLVIDATVPQPDQDSGSLRLVNVLRLLMEEGCAVTFFADNRAYVAGHVEALQRLGVEVLWHPWLSDPVSWFAEHGARFHSVLVSRHYIACSYLDLVRRHAPQARFIFDTVDLHYLREQRAAELEGSAELAKLAAQTRKQELDVINRSDVTLVVSGVERTLLDTDAPEAHVEILSNVHEVHGRRREFANRKDLMFIGGFQHPPNVDAARWFVGEVWPLIRAAKPDLRFHLIGSKAGAEVKALASEHGVSFHGYVADLDPFLDGCRLAVAPLRYGAGVKGKVNMSMSYGQPVVATPAAVEGMHLVHERDVMVAAEPRDFADAVLRLYDDAALWRQLSDNGVENVRTHFGFDAARAVVQRLLA